MNNESGTRAKRTSLHAQVERFVTAHKFIVAVVALLGIGGGAAMYMTRYATHDDVAARHAGDQAVKDQIQKLRESAAEFRSTLKAIQKSSKDTREDIGRLLHHVLENPPKRDKQ